MASRGDIVLNIAAVCGVLIAGIAVAHRIRPDLFGGAPANIAGPPQRRDPVQVAGWEKYLVDGHRMGPPDARVTILEFADFECPACGKFTREALAAARMKYPNDLAVVFRHWPLEYHKFAYPSARASECAAEQGHFEPLHDLLYAKQDSLGLKSFESYARESGVADLKAFNLCVARTDRIPVIDAGAEAAKTIGGTGTPVIVINGLRLPGGLTETAWIPS